MNPEARSRTARPCLEGSESRNRLSGDTHGAGFLPSACLCVEDQTEGSVGSTDVSEET